MRVTELFDLTKSIAGVFLGRFIYPEGTLSEISDFIVELGSKLDKNRYIETEKNIWIAKTAKVANNATIMPPCIIDEDAEIRQCAFIRGSVIVGKACVVGNSSEIKNSILFDRVQVPHFNYVGDSILGYASHLGAGAVTSNVKSDKSNVSIVRDGVKTITDRKKLGSMIGDHVEVGCGTVLCPGSIIGRNTTVYPNSVVRGSVPENSIYKSEGNVVIKREFYKEGV